MAENIHSLHSTHGQAHYALLLDLDGVVIDSEGEYTRIWDKIGTDFGVKVPDFAKIIKGNTLNRILNTYFPKEEHADVNNMLRHLERQMVYRIFPGVEHMLESVRTAGYKTAVVTSSNQEKMNRLWSQHPGLRKLFDTVITDGDISRSKPDPEGYLLAARLLEAKPTNCVVVEDSLAGMAAGHAAGAKVIGVSTTLPAEAIAGKCDLLLDTAAKITTTVLDKLVRI